MFVIYFCIQPVPPQKLERAKAHIGAFLKLYHQIALDPGITYKFHSLIHVLDDCANFLCHLEFLASYIYENFHSRWNNWLRSGNLPIEQLRFVWMIPHLINFTAWQRGNSVSFYSFCALFCYVLKVICINGLKKTRSFEWQQKHSIYK